MKKYWHFLSLATILVIVLATIMGPGTASAQTVCSPATALSVPMTTTTTGKFCWHTTTLCYQINSWNMTTLSINGTSYKNMFVYSSSIPPLNGGYTITFDGGTTPYAAGHLEITGPYQAGGTGPAGTGPCNSSPGATPTRTPIPPTATRTNTPSGPTLTPTRTATRTNTPTQGSGTVYVTTVTTSATSLNVGDSLTVTVSTNVGNPRITLLVIDTATGVEQSTTDPIFTPAPPDARNFTGGSVTTSWTLTAVRAGTVFFRANASGEMCTPVCNGGIKSGQSGNVTANNLPFPTVTATPMGSACSPVNATITAPFSFDGAGTFCWRISQMGVINSHNLTNLSVNGANLTNLWMQTSSQFFPAKIGGYWYISYKGDFPWSHFEAQP